MPGRWDDAASKPEWWERNEQLREGLGLAPYRPPQFEDGEPTFRMTDELEDDYDCTIRIRGIDTEYPKDLTVEVDGEPVATVGRHRDSNANTVYEVTSEEFRETVVAAIEESDGE